jgi:hypothetical protein
MPGKMSTLNAMYPGMSPVMILMDQPLNLKYRLIVYQGMVEGKVRQCVCR